MKPFLKKFAQVGGIVALALVLGIGVSVFADNYVGAPAFPQNAPTPLNILGDVAGAQSKGDAGLILPSTDPYAQMPLGKQNFAGSTLSLWGSTFVGKNLNVFGAANTGDLTVGTRGVSANSRVGNIFGKLFINNDTTSPSAGIKVGGDGAAGTLASTLRAALDIDLTGRTDAGGRDGLSIKSAVGQMASAFVTNSQVFHFYSDLISKDARLWAGSIKLSEYSPANGKVLVSADSEGNAVWATVNQAALKPDIKTIEEDWLDTSGDGQTATFYCPTDYAAISISCRTSGDNYPDTCQLEPDGGGSSGNTNNDTGITKDWATAAASGLYRGGTVGANGKNDSLHVVVVCQRFRNFPPLFTVPAATPVTAVGGAVGGRTWQYATVTNPTANSCALALGVTNMADVGVKVDADYVDSVNSPSPSLFSFTRPVSPNPTFGAKCMLMNDSTDKIIIVDSSNVRPPGYSWVSIGTSSIMKVDDYDAGGNLWALGEKQSFLASLEKKVSDFLIPEAHAITPGGTLPVPWVQQKGWAVVYR